MADTGNAGAGDNNIRRSNRNRPPTPHATTAADTDIVVVTSTTQEPGNPGAQTTAPAVTSAEIGGVTQALGAWTISASGVNEIGRTDPQPAEGEEALRSELQRLKLSLAWFYQHPAYQACPPPSQFPPPQPQTSVLLPAHGATNPLINYPGSSRANQERPSVTTSPQVTLPQAVTQALPSYVIPLGTAPHYTPGLSMAVSQAGTYPPAYPGAQPSLYPPLPPLQGYSYGEESYQPWQAAYNQYSLYGMAPYSQEYTDGADLTSHPKGDIPS